MSKNLKPAAKRKRSRRPSPATCSAHVCCICHHQWESVDVETARKVREAVKVNGEGPWCGMCHHLEMAERYAFHRGFTSLEGGMKKWAVLRTARTKYYVPAPNSAADEPKV